VEPRKRTNLCVCIFVLYLVLVLLDLLKLLVLLDLLTLLVLLVLLESLGGHEKKIKQDQDLDSTKELLF